MEAAPWVASRHGSQHSCHLASLDRSSLHCPGDCRNCGLTPAVPRCLCSHSAEQVEEAIAKKREELLAEQADGATAKCVYVSSLLMLLPTMVGHKAESGQSAVLG